MYENMITFTNYYLYLQTTNLRTPSWCDFEYIQLTNLMTPSWCGLEALLYNLYFLTTLHVVYSLVLPWWAKLYGGTYIFLSECVPLWREGICVMHQSWVWDDPKLGSSIVPETEMWRDTTVAVVLRWVRTSQGGSGLSTDFLVLWSGGCYVANYPYIFLINIQIYLRTKQDIISVSLETWWHLYSTKSQ